MDHVIPYSEGGPTASDNLGPLCRRHHRLKTHHSGWGYTVLEPGCYLWSSPHGYQFLRDHRGTTDVTRDRTTAPARPVATPPHTPRQHARRGATGVFQVGSAARHHLPTPACEHESRLPPDGTR